MNTSITLALDKRRAKKDNTYPIILRLSHGRQTIVISTGYSILPKYWDDSNKKIKNACTSIDNITRANNYLNKKKTEAMDIIADLDLQKKLSVFSANDLKKKIVGKSIGITFYTYTSSLIESFRKKGKLGNARSYENVLREIKKFKKNVDFKIESINYEFIRKFEESYLSRGNTLNGLAVYLRTIRAIFNYAIKDGYVDPNHYPFNDYKIKTEPTAKRSIPFELIRKIIDLELSGKPSMTLSRNLFLGSFYMMGAPFIDLAFLKKENLINGRIKYKRKKTAKPYDIKVTPQLEVILNYYLDEKTRKKMKITGSDFIFPIITGDNLETQYKQVLYALQNHNKKLKKIAKLAKIDENLSSYVSRHSFASLANNKKVPVTAISEMLGHTSVRTTQIYLAGLSNDTIDDYNDMIISGG